MSLRDDMADLAQAFDFKRRGKYSFDELADALM